MIKGRQLIQYVIDTSDITLPKKQEATEYLAYLEALHTAAEAMAQASKAFNNVTEIEYEDDEQYLFDQFQTLTKADFIKLIKAVADYEKLIRPQA